MGSSKYVTWDLICYGKSQASLHSSSEDLDSIAITPSTLRSYDFLPKRILVSF